MSRIGLLSFVVAVASAQVPLFQFEQNEGRYPAGVLFVQRGGIRMQIAKVPAEARPVGIEPTTTKYNYYLGANAALYR